MTATRRTRLADCNPRWSSGSVESTKGAARAVHFDCPEGHEGCSHTIPFTPCFDGTLNNGWHRFGATFETLTLSPSIRRIPSHATREAAIAAGCIPELVTDALLCACHIFITDGTIVFYSDSR